LARRIFLHNATIQGRSKTPPLRSLTSKPATIVLEDMPSPRLKKERHCSNPSQEFAFDLVMVATNGPSSSQTSFLVAAAHCSAKASICCAGVGAERANRVSHNILLASLARRSLVARSPPFPPLPSKPPQSQTHMCTSQQLLRSPLPSHLEASQLPRCT